ncbi:hypothetical protein H8E77_18795 [bacterium]|nr:hypothetical protein [bacterium]
MFHKLVYLTLIVTVLGSNSLSFSQVSPEIQLGARGAMSFNGEFTSEDNTSELNDFSDTGLLLGFRQKLYSNLRGQMVIGFQFPDADSELGQIFFNHIFLQIEDQSNSLKMGQSRLRNSLIEFPTLRDDDALNFTDVLNPFSSGENSEDSQYGKVLEVSKLFGQRYWLNLHGEHFTETPESPATSETDFSLNAVGLSFEYRVPETQRWNRGIVDQIGIGFLSFLTDRPGYDSEIDKALKNIIFSTILNIYPDPVHFLDVRHQTIYNLGFDEIEQVSEYPGLTRANSFATFTSLRYLYRRLERPMAQLSASFGYKVFPNLSNSTNQLQFVANGFYRIGENFDVGLQFQYQHSNGDLEKLFLENESRIQLGLTYSVEQSWNEQFDDRDSLLNLEHGYIP